MSQENVELARRAYEAFNLGDSKGMVADFAPAFEYVSTGAIPGVRGVYRGSEGLLEFAGWPWDQFENPHVEILRLIEAGDRVLAEVVLRGRGEQSGVEVSWDVWNPRTTETAGSSTGRHSRARKKAAADPRRSTDAAARPSSGGVAPGGHRTPSKLGPSPTVGRNLRAA